MAKLISQENNKAVFTAVVSSEVFKDKLNEAYRKNKHKFNIPGFRKGKAPRKIIENNYGKDVFYNDALDLILPDLYSSAIEELNLEPVSSPKVDFEGDFSSDEDLEFKFEVETYPEIELADYSNIEIEKKPETVSDVEIEMRIEDEIMKNRVIKPVDREIINGDIANIDFEGFIDGEAFEGGSAENYDLEIDSEQFIPGFEEGLVGKKKGDEVELNLKFPEDYHVEDLKGKDVVFKVKIKEVKEEVYPTFDDDFVMDISEFDTVEEYKDSIRKEMQGDLDRRNDIEIENELISEIIRRTKFDVPSQMLKDHLEDEVRDYEQHINSMGLSLDRFLELTKSTYEKLEEELKETSENKLRAQLILDAIVEQNNYEVSDEEVEKEYREVAKNNRRENDEEFIKSLKNHISEDRIRNVLMKKKAMDKLKENIVFVDKKEEKIESED